MNIKYALRKIFLLFILFISISISPSICFSKVLTWNFKAKITDVKGTPRPVMIGVAVGDTLSGSFAYDDGIIKSNPTNHYAEYYTAPVSEAYLKIDTYGLTRRKKWTNFKVAVIQQGHREIAYVRVEHTKKNFMGHVKTEEMTVRVTDNTGCFFPAEVLPIVWHMIPVDYWFTFEYELRQHNGEYIEVRARIEEMVLQCEGVKPTHLPK